MSQQQQEPIRDLKRSPERPAESAASPAKHQKLDDGSSAAVASVIDTCYNCAMQTFDLCYACDACYADKRPECILCLDCFMKKWFTALNPIVQFRTHSIFFSNTISFAGPVVPCDGCDCKDLGIDGTFKQLKPHVWTDKTSPHACPAGRNRGCTFDKAGGVTIKEFFAHALECAGRLVFKCPLDCCDATVAPSADFVANYRSFDVYGDDEGRSMPPFEYYRNLLDAHLRTSCKQPAYCDECGYSIAARLISEHARYCVAHSYATQTLQEIVRAYPDRRQLDPILSEFKVPCLTNPANFDMHRPAQMSCEEHEHIVDRFRFLKHTVASVAATMFGEGGAVTDLASLLNQVQEQMSDEDAAAAPAPAAADVQHD